MVLTIEATYENGVFVPARRPDLADHERVRLTVELATKPSPVESVRRWRGNRIQIDPHLAGEIALSPEFHPDED